MCMFSPRPIFWKEESASKDTRSVSGRGGSKCRSIFVRCVRRIYQIRALGLRLPVRFDSTCPFPSTGHIVGDHLNDGHSSQSRSKLSAEKQSYSAIPNNFHSIHEGMFSECVTFSDNMVMLSLHQHFKGRPSIKFTIILLTDNSAFETP